MTTKTTSEEDQSRNPASTTEELPGSDCRITLEEEGAAASLIFLARTRNATEVGELDELLKDMEAGCRVRILARGPVMAAAVQVRDDPDGEAITELMRLLESLGERYSFSRVQAGLHPTLNRLIEDMALDSGSDLYPAPDCSLCHRPDPFPTRLTLEDPAHPTVEGFYCHSCVARFRKGEEREWIGTLMLADKETFAEGERMEVRPDSSRAGNRISFPLKLRASQMISG